MGCLENGTPIAFGALACAATPADWFRYYAGWVDKIEGRTIPVYPHDAFDFTLHEPYGVVAVLTAFNAPMGFIGLKVAAALAAGNTVVIKPSELAPVHDAGLRRTLPGGRAAAGRGQRDHRRRRDRGPAGPLTPASTGSPSPAAATTARSIVRAAADNLTPVTLELGGKSANLVFDDADLDNAIAMAVQMGVALQSGQGCLLPTRLLVQRSVYDEVVEGVVDLSENLSIGDPMDGGTLMGPLISERHCAAGARRDRAGQVRRRGGAAHRRRPARRRPGQGLLRRAHRLRQRRQRQRARPARGVRPGALDHPASTTRPRRISIANATNYGLAGIRVHRRPRPARTA